MRLSKIEDIVRTVRYKPDSRFLVSENYGGFVEVRLEVKRPDVTGRSPIIPIRLVCNEIFPPDHMTSDYLRHTIFRLCQRLELHEVDEWLKFNGVHYRHPHPEDLKSEKPYTDADANRFLSTLGGKADLSRPD